MLVNPPQHLSHALSSRHRDVVCMKQKEREGKITLRWWFRWWSDWSTKCGPIQFAWSLEEPNIDLYNTTHYYDVYMNYCFVGE